MNSLRKKLIIAGVLTLATGGVAMAAPTVSGVAGDVSAGSTLTISGRDFGAKQQASPMLWDDFEAGPVGQRLTNAPARIGKWDSGAGSDAVTYTANRSYGGNQAARHDFVADYNASLGKNVPFQKLYMDFWIQVDYVDRKSRNWKPWRLYGDRDALQLDFVWLCSGQLVNRVHDSWSKGDWGGSTYSDNTWMHVQLVYEASTPNVEDGTIRHFIDSKVHGMNSDSVMTRRGNAHFDQIRIGHYWAQSAVDNCPTNSGATAYVDNVYLDTSWARVEIGDAPTYAGSTRREIQVPSRWTDGSISVNLNLGTFRSGQQVYLFVTDENNNTSPGFPLRIGATSTASTPEPPSSIQVR